MDPSLDLQAQRLFVATALTTQALRCLRGYVAANVDAADLLAMARRLTEQIGPIKRRYGLRLEPPSYPGVTAGVESASGTLRLVLACTAYTNEEKPLGVVFTALISGRRPQVSVAPIEAHVPRGWQELDDLA
jgi:hypothetical protein